MNNFEFTPFAAWFALIAFTLESLIGKYTSKQETITPLVFNLLRNVTSFVLMLFLLVLNPPSRLLLSIDLILAGTFYALSNLLYLYSVYRMDISIFGTLFNLRLAFSAILAALLANEVLSGWQYVLVTLIFVSGIASNYSGKFAVRSYFTPAIIPAIGTMLCLALMAVFIKRAAPVADNSLVALYLFSAALVLGLATLPRCLSDIKHLGRPQIGLISGMACFGFLGTVAVNTAYAGNVATTSAVISIPLATLAAIALGLWRPSILEQQPRKIYVVRAVASLLCAAAAIGLTML
jgi:hypothetical protein